MDFDAKKSLHDSLDDKFRTLSTFARGTAHDLNNILTGVSGNISLALDYVGSDAAAVKQKLEDAEKSLIKAKDFIASLITVTEPPRIFAVPARLDGIIERVVSDELGSSRIKYETTVQKGLCQAIIDAQSIEGALRPVLDNALKATPDNGAITVSAVETTVGEQSGLPLPPGDYVVITVSDDGPGIPDDAMPRIFEPYFSGRKRAKGLGLAAAYNIARAHGGCITAANRAGGGASVSIYLPAKKEEGGKTAASTCPSARRLLVVSVDNALAEILSELFSPLGFAIERAIGPAAGSDKGADNSHSAVMIELSDDAPEEGYASLYNLVNENPGLRVIATLPSGADAGLESTLKSRGVFSVLRRPYDLPKLIEAITTATAD
jgi:hypothetical protein